MYSLLHGFKSISAHKLSCYIAMLYISKNVIHFSTNDDDKDIVLHLMVN